MTMRARGTPAAPAGYRPTLGIRRREEAIKFVKDTFERRVAAALNLTRASAPVAVAADTGLNDHLNGVERPASFVVKALGRRAEIVQSLAKWKRAALADYGMRPGEGLYTDMNAVRPDDVLDNLHSVYVDQWDW
jgi:aspartate--ammonia ligase